MQQEMRVSRIDIVKRECHFVGIDERGQIVLRKRLTRQALTPFMAALPSLPIGLEAYGGAHYWACRFRDHGHEVKLLAPQFVKPYEQLDLVDALGDPLVTPSQKKLSIPLFGRNWP